MQERQLGFFDQADHEHAQALTDLETLPPEALLERVMQLGLETTATLRDAWSMDAYREEGQICHHFDSIADLVASDRELYVCMAQRVFDGRAAGYREAREQEIQERRDALHAAIDELRGRYYGPIRKPR